MINWSDFQFRFLGLMRVMPFVLFHMFFIFMSIVGLLGLVFVPIYLGWNKWTIPAMAVCLIMLLVGERIDTWCDERN